MSLSCHCFLPALIEWLSLSAHLVGLAALPMLQGGWSLLSSVCCPPAPFAAGLRPAEPPTHSRVQGTHLLPLPLPLLRLPPLLHCQTPSCRSRPPAVLLWTCPAPGDWWRHISLLEGLPLLRGITAGGAVNPCCAQQNSLLPCLQVLAMLCCAGLEPPPVQPAVAGGGAAHVLHRWAGRGVGAGEGGTPPCWARGGDCGACDL